ncbi:response regulator [Gloeothece verrucosa]|uniref:Response regulator receiver protein n=1 Tax=Gloeothece verrucosa (strain PCC 7822) TaxID=497965 RepID=E0U863_GLOV7|nr:response regulator [Gloeothece verrucosa]ADN17268.1 response regulator receiver protein [Gloeothece verrucosa PCC 7822]
MLKTKILICEDEHQCIKKILRPWQKEISEGRNALIIAMSVEEALNILEKDTEYEIKYGILDLKMPLAKQDGTKFLAQLINVRPEIKVIIYTDFFQEYTSLIESEASLNVGENLLGIYSKRLFPPKFIKELINMYIQADVIKLLESPDKITSKNLLSLVDTLSYKKKLKIIKALFSQLDLSTAQQLQQSFDEDITKVLEIIKQKRQDDKLRKWLIAKSREGILDPNIPAENFEANFVLEERFHDADGPYYYLRYKSPGDSKWTYVYLNSYGSLINTVPVDCARRYYLQRKANSP